MSNLSSPILLPDHPVISGKKDLHLISAVITAKTRKKKNRPREKVKIGIFLRPLVSLCYCRAVTDLAKTKSGLARLQHWSKMTESKYE